MDWLLLFFLFNLDEALGPWKDFPDSCFDPVDDIVGLGSLSMNHLPARANSEWACDDSETVEQ